MHLIVYMFDSEDVEGQIPSSRETGSLHSDLGSRITVSVLVLVPVATKAGVETRRCRVPESVPVSPVSDKHGVRTRTRTGGGRGGENGLSNRGFRLLLPPRLCKEACVGDSGLELEVYMSRLAVEMSADEKGSSGSSCLFSGLPLPVLVHVHVVFFVSRDMVRM